MTQIHVKVTGVTAEATKTGPLTRGMVGVPVTFEFSDVWNDLTITAVFKAGSRTIDHLDIKDAAVVPWELLRGEDDLYVGLYGVDQEGTRVIPTLWAYVGAPLPSADPSGDVSTIPSIPVWQELINRMNKVDNISVNGVRPDDNGNIELPMDVPQEAVEEAVNTALEQKNTVRYDWHEYVGFCAANIPGKNGINIFDGSTLNTLLSDIEGVLYHPTKTNTKSYYDRIATNFSALVGSGHISSPFNFLYAADKNNVTTYECCFCNYISAAGVLVLHRGNASDGTITYNGGTLTNTVFPDTTLSASGKPADAKAVGDAIRKAVEDINKDYVLTDADKAEIAKLVEVPEAEPGKNGITPHIGANGNWYLGETDTGVKAQGKDSVGVVDIQKRTVAGREVLYIILSDGTEKGFSLPVPENGKDYVLTDVDKQEIAEQAAELVDVPDSYTKAEIDAIMGSYITDINTLVGGDA